MVDATRQVPAPSASSWSIDLGPAGGPVFVVQRLDEAEARRVLARHLYEIGAFRTEAEAKAVVEAARAKSVAVIW